MGELTLQNDCINTVCGIKVVIGLLMSIESGTYKTVPLFSLPRYVRKCESDESSKNSTERSCFRVEGLGFKVQGSGFRVLGVGLRVES
jgi:hypothetical protein